MTNPNTLIARLREQVTRPDHCGRCALFTEAADALAALQQEQQDALIERRELGDRHAVAVERALKAEAELVALYASAGEPTLSCGRCNAVGEFYHHWELCEDCFKVVYPTHRAAEEPKDWQPIETAPTSQRILIGGGDCAVCEVMFGRHGEWLRFMKPPTHWMKLPAPPARDVWTAEDIADIKQRARDRMVKMGLKPAASPVSAQEKP
jgi:hypothetical protein